MNTFLFRVFIKDWENVKEPKVRDAYGRLAGAAGILSNLVLCLMKVAAGLLSCSIAIVADGINNLADSGSSLITLLGFKLASLPEDEDHPYGHARYEYLAGLAVSIIIILVGFELVKSSASKILNPQPLEFSWTVVLVLLAAIAIKIWQAAFNRTAGRRIDSVALLATAADSRNDVISTLAVLVSLLISHFAEVNLDGWMGLAVALFIMWSGVGLVRKTVSPLLGEAPDPKLVQQIRTLVTSYGGVLGIHDLEVHSYGPGKTFAALHIEVDSAMDMMTAHNLADSIEKKLRDVLQINITVHLDPVNVTHPDRIPLTEVLDRAVEAVPEILSIHDLRIESGPTHTNVIFDVVVSGSCRLTEAEILRYFNRRLAEYDEHFHAMIKIDRNYISLNE